MQAAARSYRLNQTHPHCKVYYLYAEDTMEATAVQLMSRKQRAAKLLTGDTGLTGLDALTEGEGGFEEALLDAIGRDETLLDPSDLFKVQAAQGEVDAEDAAFWNVKVDRQERAPLPMAAAAVETDPLVQAAIELGGVITEELTAPRSVEEYPRPVTRQPARQLERAVGSYFATVHILPDRIRSTRLQAELLRVLTEGVPGIPGLSDVTFDRAVHEASLVDWTRGWLEQHRVVFAGYEAEVAARLVLLAREALTSPEVDTAALYEGHETHDEPPETVSYAAMPLWKPEVPAPVEPVRTRRRVRQGETAVQLALF
jgi:flavin-binding protein dodecin